MISVCVEEGIKNFLACLHSKKKSQKDITEIPMVRKF